MPSSHKTIEDFHSEIVQWRSEGQSLRIIAAVLQERGLAVDHNAVNRYFRNKRRIPFVPPVEGDPEQADDESGNGEGKPSAGGDETQTELFKSEPRVVAPPRKTEPAEHPRERANTAISQGVGLHPDRYVFPWEHIRSDFFLGKHNARPPFNSDSLPTTRSRSTASCPRGDHATAGRQASCSHRAPGGVQRLPEDFPDLNMRRLDIGVYSVMGWKLEAIQRTLADDYGLQTTTERLREFLEAVINQAFPPRNAQPESLLHHQGGRELA